MPILIAGCGHLFDNIAAIDIGSTAIRAVAVKTGLKEFQVKFLSLEEIDLSIPDWNEAASQAVRRLIDDNDLGQHTICATLPMELALIRNLSFPFSDITKIASVLPSEAEEQMPVETENLVLDFKPLNSVEGETPVLVAGVHKNSLDSFLSIFTSAGIAPSFLGLEAVSLFETYKYFNPPSEEAVVLVNIGYKKTVIAIINGGNLIYTRAVSVGTSDMDRAVAEILDIEQEKASALLKRLQLDLTSLEKNITRGYYSVEGLTKPALKKVYNAVVTVAETLQMEMILTLAASPVPRAVPLSRILISGGGASIPGIGGILSSELALPVVSLPFINELKDNPAEGRFAIAFGTVLSYLNPSEKKIDFLKDKYASLSQTGGLKSYYFAAGLGALTLVIIFITLLFNSIMTAHINSKYNVILSERYRRYFHTRPSGDDPVEEARKLVKRESRETGDLAKLVTTDDSMMDLLRDITSAFPGDPSFDIQNIVINERIVRIDGTISSSSNLDTFKRKLEELKNIDSVSLNVKSSPKNAVKFSMTIKQKITVTRPSDDKEAS